MHPPNNKDVFADTLNPMNIVEIKSAAWDFSHFW